ncbi:fluoroquinolone transport system permease protein [Murinocardiopsis flavida]|uniref:Fluoroquinolone transport system permease protein n=1 Tax=Murinocardiopsis flavida TaxID=645275 RepID=A0A2P8DMI1_9ACTN|nr:hypothetical protein [Murinocardiopsis flavida]PSK98423.1 fluoroquinolone transport system permease protein [Murinocardiopsis flavida]
MKRLRAAVALEFKVARRYGVVAVAAVLCLLWTGVLAALPAPVSAAVAPFLLFLDTAGFGALFAVALLLFERVEGMGAARTVTPLRAGESAAARIAVLTALAAAMAVPITAAAVPMERSGAALGLAAAGVALSSVLLVSVCLAIGARARSLGGSLLAVPPAVVPLIAVPMAHLSVGLQHPLLFAVPTTAGAELIRLGISGAPGPLDEIRLGLAVAYAALCAGAACRWAARAVAGGLDHSAAAPPPAVRWAAALPAFDRTRPAARPGNGRPLDTADGRRGGAVRAVLRFARFDLAGTGRDPLLLVVAAAPVPLALALRWGFPPVDAYVQGAYGVGLTPYAAPLFGALVLLHVPTMLGSVVALRVAEDIDDNTLLVVRVSPLTLRSYLGYRMAVAAAFSAIGLAAAVPLSGLAPPASPGLVAAVVLAAGYAPLIVLAAAAFAGNKVEALVVLKGVGALSVLLPGLVWALPSPWWWPVLAVPPAWALLPLSGHAPGLLPAGAAVLCGAAAAVVAGLLLAHRARARLDS